MSKYGAKKTKAAHLRGDIDEYIYAYEARAWGGGAR